MALNRPWKGHINSLRVETRGRASPCLTSAGNARMRLFKFLDTCHMKTMTMKALQIFIWKLQINFNKRQICKYGIRE